PIALIRLSDYEAMQAEQVPDAIQLLQRVAASATDKSADDNGTGNVLWSDTHSVDEILEEHSDNVLFDVVANLWEDIRCLKEDKPAEAVPGCFMKLYDSARGMRFGTDWNMGTAARNHRRPLI